MARWLPRSLQWWMPSFSEDRGGVPLGELAQGKSSPAEATDQTAKGTSDLGPVPWAFTNGTQGSRPHIYPLPVSSCRPHLLGLLRRPPWVLTVGAKSEVQGETDACYPGLFSSPYKEAGRYRSLHFHVYIQGHFLSKSIEQSEYTIFMSQCILELKYIEGNKNNKALKEGQHR